jgi:signal transduction histidine kinase
MRRAAKGARRMENGTPTDREHLRGPLRDAAEVLEARFEEVISAYERKLLDANSPLVAEAVTRDELKDQAHAVLEDVVGHLRGREPSEVRGHRDDLSVGIGGARARGRVHPSESLRAVIALSEAALSVVVEALPPSPTSRSEVAAVALAIQKSILERVLRASVSYVEYLIAKLHESHADERRRIGRELHDRVAHPIVVVFRSLELYEIYRDRRDDSRAREQTDSQSLQRIAGASLTGNCRLNYVTFLEDE